MSIQNSFNYNEIFDGDRPKIQIVLEDISSTRTIRLISFINEVISFKGDTISSQLFIWDYLISDLPDEIKSNLLSRNIRLKLLNGGILFSSFYNTEFVNRELINYRSIIGSNDQNPSVLYNFIKAYTIIIDEINEVDILRAADALADVKKGGDENLVKLMWPHFIRQFEFATVLSKTDLVLTYNILRSFAFISYLEKHAKYSEHVKSYFKSLGCGNGYHYTFKILDIITTHARRSISNDPQDYFTTINTEELDPVIESLVIDPVKIQNSLKSQKDFRGQKERPIYKINENEYLVPNWNYLYNAMFSGLIFSTYYDSNIKKVEKSFGDFKAILSKEFSEQILFIGLMKKCFSNQNTFLTFFNDENVFNPDCYYREGNDVFVIEFKDSLLNSDIIQSGSYNLIKRSINEKFVHDSNTESDKGIYQLARNIEMLASDETLFWKIDDNASEGQIGLDKIIIHPIIIQTNDYFNLPGVNDYLNDLLQIRLRPIRAFFGQIASFTMIDMKFFFERMLMFADSKITLASELNFYHNTILSMKNKTNQTRNEQDWFNSKMPISIFKSPEYENRDCRFSNFKEELSEGWGI